MKNKKALSLILALVAVIALCAAYYFISQNQEEDNTGDVDESVLVSSLAETINTITYTTAAGEQLTLKLVNDAWQWDGDDEFPMRQVRPRNMVNSVSPLNANQLVAESTDDLAQYGLDKPQNEITISNTNGDEITYLLGSANSHTGDYYLQVKGESAVYTVSAEFAENFSFGLDDMLRTDFWPIVQNTTVHSISVKNPKDEFTVDIEDSTGEDGLTIVHTYHVTNASGQSFTGDKTAGDQMLAYLTTLSVYSCENYKVKDSELAQYGLDNPSGIITVNYTQAGTDTAETVVLYCGAEKDDKTYVRFEGSAAVDLMKTELLKTYMALLSANLMP